MDTSFSLTILIVLTVLAGVTAQVIGEFLKVPSIIFLLLFGIGLGQDGLGVLHPQELGVGLEVIVALSVALILFEGGLSLELSELGQVSDSLRNLVTVGIFVTLVGGGMAAHWLGEFPWSLAFLYASLVVVTGPTVINPVLRQVKVDRKVSTLLRRRRRTDRPRWGNSGRGGAGYYSQRRHRPQLCHRRVDCAIGHRYSDWCHRRRDHWAISQARQLFVGGFAQPGGVGRVMGIMGAGSDHP
jgi:hypothetical protein